MSVRAFLGISHSPLLALKRLSPAAESTLHAALDAARDHVLSFDPELVVLIAPDHYNGFFNGLMPPSCIGTQATSAGDYASMPGPLNVDATAVLALARRLMDEDFDVAASHRMLPRSGASPHLAHRLGRAVPRTARADDVRTGSGSTRAYHAQPGGHFGTARGTHAPRHGGGLQRDQADQPHLGRTLDERAGRRRNRVGRAVQTDGGQHRAGCRFLRRRVQSWLMARCALPTARALPCRMRHYQLIPEYIAGFGVMLLDQPL